MGVGTRQPYGVQLPFNQDGAYTLFKNQYTGSGGSSGGGGGGGTVTSVGLSLPSLLFSVSGSPVTTTGTLAATLAAQNANLVFAGPTIGAAAAPTFRALVAADIPGGAGSPLTTKGDLYTFSTVNARLAVGSNNYMLTPDSAQTTGLKWADPLTVIPAFVASGASHATGLVPDPGSTTGTTKFLREDATWAVPSGGSGGNYTKIAQVVCAGSQTTITFSSIPGTYTDLQLVLTGSLAAGASAQTLYMKFNGAGSGTYRSTTYEGGNGASNFTGTLAPSAGGAAAGGLSGTGSTANPISTHDIRIFGYAATSSALTFKNFISYLSGDIVGNFQAVRYAGAWNSDTGTGPTAITQIDLTNGSGSAFADNTVATLYGIG